RRARGEAAELPRRASGTLRIVSILFEIAAGDRRLLILEDRHCRPHAPEAESLVERLLAGYGIENDLLVPARQLDEPADDLPAEPLALMGRQDGDVADVRTIAAVGDRAARADETPVVVDETAIQT